MKRIRLLITISLAAVAAAFFFRRSPRIPERPESIGDVERAIAEMTGRSSPPGLSIVVLKDGNTVYSRSFGWADAPREIPAAVNTRYHWWSLTKIVTAAAVLQLVDAGQLDLDHPVHTYLPFFEAELDRAPSPPITIRQLLRHTSGLPDTVPAIIGWVHYDDVIFDQTAMVRKYLPEYNRLKFAPDTDSAYSNFGYMVLGAVVEAVTGSSYEAYVESEILRPLGMGAASFLYRPDDERQRAAGSHPLLSFYTPMLPFLLDMDSLVRERVGARFWFNPVYLDVTPSSGLIGSVEDAAVLAKALLHPGLLSPESGALLIPQGSEPVERPLGWAEYNVDDRLWVQHLGGGPGFAALLRLYPEEDLGIILMSNSTNLDGPALADALASLDW